MTAGGQARKGSILSMWEGGKDKQGRDILAHDDHHSDEEEEDGNVSVGSPASEESEKLAAQERERRGSILSVWRKGKDEHGNHAIVHDDEEWREFDPETNTFPKRRTSSTGSRPKQREELPTSSFFA